MAWKFDPTLEDIVWQESTEQIISSGDGALMSFSYLGDMFLESGDRTNTESIIDQGTRDNGNL